MAEAAVVAHQLLDVALDLQACKLRGFTELDIEPPPTGTKVVALHSHGLCIEGASINGVKVADINVGEVLAKDATKQANIFKDKKAKLAAAGVADCIYRNYHETLDQESRPNLQLQVPDEILGTQQGSDELLWRVRIEFSVCGREEAAAVGAHFWENWAQCITQPGTTRTWFPCAHRASHRATYAFRVTVPPNLMAVCSGQLKQQLWTNAGRSRTFVYELGMPVNAQQVSLVVGPMVPFPCYWPQNTENPADMPQEGGELRRSNHASNTVITHLAPQECKHATEATLGFLHLPFQLFEKHFGSADFPLDFPFATFSFTIVPNNLASLPIIPTASTCILSTDQLVDRRILEQGIESRLRVVEAVATQWFGVFMVASSPTDQWLINGLSGHLTSLYVRRFMGINEYNYRRFKEREAIVVLDDGVAPPLCPRAPATCGGGTLGSEAAWPLGCIMPDGGLLKWKATAVMGMLERRVGEDNFRKFLSRQVQNAEPSASDSRTLGTRSFLRELAKISGLKKGELEAFAERWIYGRGCPRLEAAFAYNRKRNGLELALRQEGNASSWTSARSAGGIGTRDGTGVGVIKVAVAEVDGEFEHPVYLGDEGTALTELKCHSKLTSRRSGPKAGKVDRRSAAARELGASDAGKVSAATSAALEKTPINWISVDPGHEWLASVRVMLPEAMLCACLAEAKDVCVQGEAVEALARLAASAKPDESTETPLLALADCLRNSTIFCRVRCAAAAALGRLARPSTNQALHYLISYLHARLFDPELRMPKPLQFGDLSELVVVQAAAAALCAVRDESNTTPTEAVELLLEVLEEADSSVCDIDDGNLRAHLLDALGRCLLSEADAVGRVATVLDRHIAYDRVIPSYGNVVAGSAVGALVQLLLNHPWGRAAEGQARALATQLAAPGNSLQLRRSAHRALLMLDVPTQGLDAAVNRVLDAVSLCRGEGSGSGSMPEHLAASLMEDMLVDLPAASGHSWKLNEPSKRIKWDTMLRLNDIAVGPRAAASSRTRHLAFMLSQVLGGKAPTLYRATDADSLQARRVQQTGRGISGAPAASGGFSGDVGGAGKSHLAPGRSARTGGHGKHGEEGNESAGGSRRQVIMKIKIGGKSGLGGEGAQEIPVPSSSVDTKVRLKQAAAAEAIRPQQGLKITLGGGKPAAPPQQEQVGSKKRARADGDSDEEEETLLAKKARLGQGGGTSDSTRGVSEKGNVASGAGAKKAKLSSPPEVTKQARATVMLQPKSERMPAPPSLKAPHPAGAAPKGPNPKQTAAPLNVKMKSSKPLQVKTSGAPDAAAVNPGNLSPTMIQKLMSDAENQHQHGKKGGKRVKLEGGVKKQEVGKGGRPGGPSIKVKLGGGEGGRVVSKVEPETISTVGPEVGVAAGEGGGGGEGRGRRLCSSVAWGW